MRSFGKMTGRAMVLALSMVALARLAFAGGDLGQDIQGQIEAHSVQNFGIAQGLDASSNTNITKAQAEADPTQLVTLAQGLKARVAFFAPAPTAPATTNVPNLDMISLWPDDTNPTHLIVCNEQGAGQIGLVRIDLETGTSANIVKSGLSSCDPTRRTPWGTILFGEEAGTAGRLFELIDPLNTTDVDIVGNVPTGGTNPGNIVLRSALGNLSFEGLAVYPNGIVYYGDENRPSDGTAGGAYFKFVPATLRDPEAGNITDLSQSPLVAGSIYGLRVGLLLSSGHLDYGQGTQTGLGAWVAVVGPNLRTAAAANKLTGYYRPEDIDIDLVALGNGVVRFCGNNTGNEGNSPLTEGHTYGETICLTDGTLAEAAANTAKPEVQYLVIGNPQLSMMDNMAYQPGRGNWIIHEDGEELTGHNDLWSCADDGQDADLLSDGCIRIATLNNGGVNGAGAEWTGGIFTADGKHFYVSVQHNVTGRGLILDITGWK